jgi:hypothetical protein
MFGTTSQRGTLPMATIIAIHGTFAHVNEAPGADGRVREEHLWWHPGSTFEKKMAASLVAANPQGVAEPVKVERFIWNGYNSETDRRAAAARLLDRMMELEGKNEIYVAVGHSHGGSVVSTALLMAASRRLPLTGLRQWITVGTPFIEMRRMPRLIDRLNLIQRVILVASMMLLMMFLFFVAGQLLDNTPGIALPGDGAGADTSRQAIAKRTLLAALLTSLPALAVTILFRLIDRQTLFFYRKKTIERARSAFGPRWQSFCHPADEAVQGLHAVSKTKIQLFDPGFAAQRLTLIAVFVMPIAYLVLLGTPSFMVGLANLFKTQVYQVEKYADVEKAFDVERQEVRGAARAAIPVNTPADVQTVGVGWDDVRKLREELKRKYPNYTAIERALRFKHTFFQVNGKSCDGDLLCGRGRDFAVNSRLLYHVATDDVISAVINDDTRFGIYGNYVRASLPMVLVPVISVLLALLAMVIIGWIARLLSRLLAAILNRTTLSEIKRELYGNDTGTEIALGVEPRPAWMDVGRPYLPPGLADRLTAYANAAAFASLAKFRNALSMVAMSTGHPPSGGVVSDYLSWRELIHSAYLDYAEFQALVACSIAKLDGFAATPVLHADPHYANANTWLAALAAVSAREPLTTASKPATARAAGAPQPT